MKEHFLISTILILLGYPIILSITSRGKYIQTLLKTYTQYYRLRSR